ncbi:gp146 [Listeria phage A511]|uniref:Gp146 n=1 Tax=Listeria phage A511 TaxID=2908169 RepID=A8ASY0_BPA51|nr:gp146 [Listeria phage A511]AAY52927.1 gp146 [Listeria phage A511]
MEDNFVTAYNKGEQTWDDLAFWEESWNNDPNHIANLAEYLGMTDRDYWNYVVMDKEVPKELLPRSEQPQLETKYIYHICHKKNEVQIFKEGSLVSHNGKVVQVDKIVSVIITENNSVAIHLKIKEGTK